MAPLASIARAVKKRLKKAEAIRQIIGGVPIGVDLTFATYLAAISSSQCQIQNSTSSLNLLVVPLILPFAKVTAETPCEC
jgi:hypothetical protein